MKVYFELDLNEFEAWAGGRDRLTELCEHDDAYDDICAMLEDAYSDGISETELNDFLWFELDDYLEELGYKDSDGNWIDD